MIPDFPEIIHISFILNVKFIKFFLVFPYREKSCNSLTPLEKYPAPIFETVD